MVGLLVTTAIALIFVVLIFPVLCPPILPCATAVNMAVRSAQLVAPKLAFSTLHPVVSVPSVSKTAAPTWNLEYGA